MIFLRIINITQTFMSHDWICNTLILHRLKEIAIQNKEWINLGNDDLMHMKEETQWLYKCTSIMILFR